MAKVSTWKAAHDVSISSRNVSSVSGFVRFTTSFRDPHRWKSMRVESGERGAYSTLFLRLFIDLVRFHQGSFWRLGGSVVVRHLVKSKMAPSLSAHCCADFCVDHVNYSNSITEEAGLVAVQGLPDLCLCTSCTVPSVSNLSGMRAIVNSVGASIANTRRH
jgi:hypothetical protein